MITSLEIINFRSHRHTKLDFCKGINVFVGRGQAGKTNIKRAIEWLCFNRPSGGKIHSRWCEKGDITKVSATTDDGHIVTIQKAVEGGIEYILKAPNNKKETFRKVGRNVPDRVVEVLRLEDINIQGQIDQPFLVTDSSGEISKRINEIIDLEIADGWIKDLNSKKSATNSEIAILERDHAEAIDRSKAFRGLDRVRVTLTTARKIRDRIDNRWEKLDAINVYSATVKAAEEKVKECEFILQIEPLVNKAQNILEKLEKADMIRGALEDYRNLQIEAEDKAAHYLEVQKLYVDALQAYGLCPYCLKKLSEQDVHALSRR